jgi:type II secretory pathway component PulJ
MRRRYSLTLIEVIISLSLATVLFAGLFYHYFSVTRASGILEKEKDKILSRQVMHLRIAQALGQLGTIDAKDGEIFEAAEEKGGFQMKWKALSNREVEPFTYILSFRRDEGLTLKIEKGEAPPEKLADEISGAKALFFDEKEWLTAWTKKQKGPPSMIKLILEIEKQEIPFVYFL